MLGNFSYCNPTKLYFGKNAMEGLEKEQMIGMPLLEVARGQAELEADNVQKMMQALAGAVPREEKKEP